MPLDGRDILGRSLPPDAGAAARQREQAERIVAVLGPNRPVPPVTARSFQPQPPQLPQPPQQGPSEVEQVARQLGVVISRLRSVENRVAGGRSDDDARLVALERRLLPLEGRKQESAGHIAALAARIDRLEAEARAQAAKPPREIAGARISAAGHLVLRFSDGGEQDIGIVRENGT